MKKIPGKIESLIQEKLNKVTSKNDSEYGPKIAMKGYGDEFHNDRLTLQKHLPSKIYGSEDSKKNGGCYICLCKNFFSEVTEALAFDTQDANLTSQSNMKFTVMKSKVDISNSLSKMNDNTDGNIISRNSQLNEKIINISKVLINFI